MKQGKQIPPSELVLKEDNSVYHLGLHPEQIGTDIIIAGDPGRIELISSFFDRIDHKVKNREFVTHTGFYKGKKVTAMATGIGTDNIDIVINELDALVNIDLEKRTAKNRLTSLNIVRIGTSGALQEDIPVDSHVMAEYGLGMDGLLHYYQHRQSKTESELQKAFIAHTDWNPALSTPYFVPASEKLLNLFEKDCIKGITATAPGFYGPQGRVLRLPLYDERINEKLNSFRHGKHKITNFEMETSALYGLGSLLGHHCCTICSIIANRFTNEFSSNYRHSIEKLVSKVLNGLTSQG